MNDKLRTPFNSSPVLRPGCQHLLGCRCEPSYWHLDANDPRLAIAEAEHRRRLGMDRISVPSPSVLCGIVGCARQDAHEHSVVA